MSLLGKACLAMWWDMAADMRAEFEHWHSHEHFPERLGLPGFHRASRWTSADGGEGIFVMYELASHEILSSPPYLASLNAPSPWSAKMMPHHRNMVRSQCRVLASRGAGVARQALTVRLSPASGRGAELLAALKPRMAQWMGLPGLAGVHLLRHEAPPIATTTEQKIRGADQTADWVLVACGYDATMLGELAQTLFSEDNLTKLGARPGQVNALYALSHSATVPEIQ